jgi:hypothetical protein
MVDDLIRRARHRFLWNETLAQFAFAAAVIVAGFALLLVVGTRFMGWWTLGVCALAGAALGAYRVWKRVPDPYATAVRLDANAGLHDALSTALHFSLNDADSPAFQRSQREQAETVAGNLRLEEAAPFVIPRTLYAMAALCVLASALIGLRFGIGNGLDLRAPLTQFLIEDQAAAQDAKKHSGTLAKAQTKWTQEAESLLSKLGLEPKPGEPAPGDPDALEKALEQALQNPPEATPKSDKASGADKGGDPKEGAKPDESKADPLDNSDQSGADQTGADGKESKQGDKGSKEGSGKNPNSGNKESLLARLKDAVSNMISKPNEDSAQKGPPQSAQKGAQDGAKGPAGRGEQQQNQSDAQNGQPDADGQSGQQAQGKMNSKADSKPGESGSGIGSQDGAKEIKAAEQLKAMGKISEIIGQRAATVTGETMVEVESGSQKLHTEYSKTSAAHAETDGDVTRDEIPLGLQSYVQQYFAEVRKKAAAATPAPAAPADAK